MSESNTVHAPKIVRRRRSSLVKNQHGQAMGGKGLKTRRYLMSVTEKLLRTQPLSDLTVAEISKRAKFTTATFYLYFKDTREAVLAVVSEISQSTPDLIGQLSSPWPPAEAHQRAQRFVETYVAAWAANAALFRVRNLAADEGDQDFVAVRANSLKPLLESVAERIAERQAGKALAAGVDPNCAAIALVSMLERIGTVPGGVMRGKAFTTSDVLDAAAMIVGMVVGGATPTKG
ncbi:MAG: TetR/AcrR family transcriptional regulator [Caulobacteraceae bacterium]|nr:TetR/AcrR family transcriptional regulator [Caulobacteraceae bacterium]